MCRYKAPTVHIPVSTCPDIKPLLSTGFRLNEVAAAQRRQLLLLVMHEARDFISQLAFPVIQLGDEGNDSDRKKESEKPKLLRRLSSKKDRGDGKSSNKRRFSSSSVDGKKPKDETLTKSASDGKVLTEKVKPRCVGVIRPPRKDMTIISCHISPDLSETGIMFYSLSPTTKVFCYTLHCYSNVSLCNENSSERDLKAEPQQKGACKLPEERTTPNLLRSVKLSREVQPYFAYDPRYGSSRIAVANYECRDESIVHELVVLCLERTRGAAQKEATVVKRGKLSLPALFGNSRFNLLYSKDGELIILQKLTDDRFGVTSFCDIYIFHADDLTLIKYMTAALPGLFHICKVSYEPVFSRCGSFMRILNHRVSNGDDDDNEEGVEYTMVNVYQLPRSLNLMSQCRRVILQQITACRSVELLPLPHRLKDYLKFGPIY